jgi:hypothetical protein
MIRFILRKNFEEDRTTRGRLRDPAAVWCRRLYRRTMHVDTDQVDRYSPNWSHRICYIASRNSCVGLYSKTKQNNTKNNNSIIYTTYCSTSRHWRPHLRPHLRPQRPHLRPQTTYSFNLHAKLSLHTLRLVRTLSINGSSTFGCKSSHRGLTSIATRRFYCRLDDNAQEHTTPTSDPRNGDVIE